jgi:hypothetical protein
MLSSPPRHALPKSRLTTTDSMSIKTLEGPPVAVNSPSPRETTRRRVDLRSGASCVRRILITVSLHAALIANAVAAAGEAVIVKYRGPVDLAPFKCDTITRSSFIRRVCYDAENAYMLINLRGTWYHYCKIDSGTVSTLKAAKSMGRFYNESIKGNFDCRTRRVPDYQ